MRRQALRFRNGSHPRPRARRCHDRRRVAVEKAGEIEPVRIEPGVAIQHEKALMQSGSGMQEAPPVLQAGLYDHLELEPEASGEFVVAGIVANQPGLMPGQ